MKSQSRQLSWWHGGLLATVVVASLMAPVHAAAASISLTSQHLTTTATCALVSYPASSTYGTDSWVNQSVAGQNNGTATQLTIKSLTNGNDRLYARFDLTKCLFAPPAGAIVRSATLRVFETALPAACNTFDVFRNSSTWAETTVTWTNQPAGTTANQPPTAQATSQSVSVGSPGTCAIHTTNTYVTWDVKTDVAAFLAGTATNYGWMIRNDTEGQSSAQTANFAARELNTLADAPQLLITYSRV
jgi:hypothetical protein